MSGWQDSNLRPLRPERSALPTALHPDCIMGVNPKACAKLQVFSDIRASFHYFFCLMTISEKFFAKNLQVSNISRTFAPAIKQHSVGAIAQLVEQRTENPCVPGSIPGGTTTKRSYSLEWLLFCCINAPLLYWYYYNNPCQCTPCLHSYKSLRLSAYTPTPYTLSRSNTIYEPLYCV